MAQHWHDKKFIEELRAKAPVITFKLERPILNPFAPDQQTDELSFREPSAGDILITGNPVKSFDPESGAVNYDEAKMFEMMAALSGVPVLSLMRMTPNDAVTCMHGLARFFIPGLLTLPAQKTAQPTKPAEQPAS